MKQAMVSVIVPCYNQAQFLDDALQSVLEQSYPYWECIIINDGSMDDTKDLADVWLKKDSRFQYIFQTNGGLSSARNTGIAKAKGTFILPLDADDKISSAYLEQAVAAFDSDHTLKIVYCEAEYFGEKSGRWHLLPYSFFKLLRQNMIFCTALFKKEDWNRVGGYDTKMKYGLEDWEFWIHILKDGGPVKKLDTVGFYYRIKSESMIKGMTEDQITYTYDYVLNKHKDVFYKNYDALLKDKKQMASRLRSRKFIIRLFLKRFFK